MKILMMNNFNYARGGAENVFLSEIQLLKNNGHEVTVFSCRHPRNQPTAFSRYFPSERITDAITPSAKGLRSLLGLIYSLESKRQLRTLLDTVEVDVAHAHNIYARLTTSVLDLLYDKKIPIVMTLHDYKVICPNYKLLNHGKICADCQGNRYYSAILNRCHMDSLIASTIYSVETYFNFFLKKYLKNIKIFISPSKFLKEKIIEFGWPENRIEWIPNFLTVKDIEPDYYPGNYFLYLGRISNEKGVGTLLNAFSNIKMPNVFLKIAGEGPLLSLLNENFSHDSRVSFLGHLSGNSLSEKIRKALAIVVPSEWYENAPLSVLEAMAYGKTVIGANIGGIPEMIDDGINGFLFKSGDVRSLVKSMSKVLTMDDQQIVEIGRRAREKVELEYSSELHYKMLLNFYQKAIKQPT